MYRPGLVDVRQQAWEYSRIALVPPRWAKEFQRKFALKKTPDDIRTANIWLREETERFKSYRVPLNASDAEIIEISRARVKDVMSLAGICVGVEQLREKAGELCQRWGIEPPAPLTVSQKTGEIQGVRDRPAIARMTDEQWWRRKLRVVHGRMLETEAVRLGFVHRKADIYCSNETFERRQQQRRRNAATLDQLIAENDQGQQFTLAQLAALSVANPAIRRGELMTRIAGFEECAKIEGHAAEFVTLTCPSEYHARLSQTGEENPRYAGHTARDGQKYLAGIWKLIRSSLARAKVALYGFRIAEPHHDSCPHWHMIFFLQGEALAKFRDVFRRYALRSSPDEPGAQENRVKFQSIDMAKGSAAGYVAKYISKNIDGFGIESDLFGNPALVASARVESWASTWGIRQFQQIGGPAVGVWRELRRMGEGKTDTTEQARAAADAGDWSGYVQANGGAVCKRKDRPLTLAKTRAGERMNDGNPEPAPPTRYGEEAGAAVYGVLDVVKGVATASRRFVWRIVKGKTTGGAVSAPWSPVNNCTKSISEGVAMLGMLIGRIAQKGEGNEQDEGGSIGGSGTAGDGGGKNGTKPAGSVQKPGSVQNPSGRRGRSNSSGDGGAYKGGAGGKRGE